MILREIADTLIRSVSGGTNGLDNKYEPEYVEGLIPALRSEAMLISYYGNRSRAASRRIDYAWYQEMTIEVNKVDNNTKDYITFTAPKTVSLGRLVDGFVYVGQVDSSVEFSRMLNRSDIAMTKARGMLNGESIAYIWQAPNLEVYGNNALEEINVRGVFADPMEVTGFNPEVNDYPITEDLLLIMTDLFKANQNINIQKPSDQVLDGAQTQEKGVINNNLR
jgi:hypothetical protein